MCVRCVASLAWSSAWYYGVYGFFLLWGPALPNIKGGYLCSMITSNTYCCTSHLPHPQCPTPSESAIARVHLVAVQLRPPTGVQASTLPH